MWDLKTGYQTKPQQNRLIPMPRTHFDQYYFSSGLFSCYVTSASDKIFKDHISKDINCHICFADWFQILTYFHKIAAIFQVISSLMCHTGWYIINIIFTQ